MTRWSKEILCYHNPNKHFVVHLDMFKLINNVHMFHYFKFFKGFPVLKGYMVLLCIFMAYFWHIKSWKLCTIVLSLIFPMFFYDDLTILLWDSNKFRTLKTLSKILMHGHFSNFGPLWQIENILHFTFKTLKFMKPIHEALRKLYIWIHLLMRTTLHMHLF